MHIINKLFKVIVIQKNHKCLISWVELNGMLGIKYEGLVKNRLKWNMFVLLVKQIQI